MARPPSQKISKHYTPRISPRSPWQATWRITRADGTRGSKYAFFATEEECEAFIREIEREAASLPELPRDPLPPALRTPAELPPVRVGLDYQTFAEEWLTTYVARKAPATARSYEGILRTHVFPHLGRTPLTDSAFDISAITHLLAVRQKAGIGWGTQKVILRVVSSSLSWAVLTRKLTANPVRGMVKLLKDESGDYQDPEPNPLSVEHAEAFLTWLETGRVPGVDRAVDGPRFSRGARRLRAVGFPEWLPYFLTLLRTGMRRGEAAALKWSTVFLDGDSPSIRLTASYSPSRARVEGSSHGDGKLKGKRPHTIDVSAELAEVLRTLARTRREAALHARRTLSPYVFLAPGGSRIRSDNAQAVRIFERGMAAIGCTEAHTIHDLRDTFATAHLTAGAPLLWVSSMLGHRHASTTLTRYARWIPNQGGGQMFASALDRTRGKLDHSPVSVSLSKRGGFSE